MHEFLSIYFYLGVLTKLTFFLNYLFRFQFFLSELHQGIFWSTLDAKDHKELKKISTRLLSRKFNPESQGPNVCDCGRSYKNLRHLTYHRKWECGKDLRCQCCFKKFFYKSHLSGHLKKCPIYLHRNGLPIDMKDLDPINNMRMLHK